MLFSYPFAALSVAALVSGRPLPHYRRQSTITDFGSCNATPDIIFALGLDGRKDPSFQAKNNNVYNHGSALGIGVITSFICQQLNDRCKAPQATLDACASGQAEAAKVTGGAAADSFNAAFGITTNFASGAASGNGAANDAEASSKTQAVTTTSGVETKSASATATDAVSATTTATEVASTCATASTITVTVDATTTASTPCPTDPVTVTVTGTGAVAAPTATSAASEVTTTTASVSTSKEAVSTSTSTTPAALPTSTGAVSALDFGSCTNPTIEFGPAFEGRKAAEFSNKPVNKQEFNQASALNIDIVTRAICDVLANKCKAPQATLDACAKGKAAASAAAAKTGAQADAFNAALGITTNFATIPAAPGGGPGSAALANTPNFGTCTNPTMEFGVGFDGRTEASFQPANKADFNHGSALNPVIIATAICDAFVNSCNANKPAIDNCAAAKAAITGLTGQAVADAFNAAVLNGAAQ